MRTLRSSGVILLLVSLVLMPSWSGCAKSSNGSSPDTIPIKTLLGDPTQYNDKTVTISGVVGSSAGAFGQGAYEVNDGTGELTVLTNEGQPPPEGARVIVTGEFESIFTLGSETGAVLKEEKRTVG